MINTKFGKKLLVVFGLILLTEIPAVYAQSAEQNTYMRLVKTGMEQLKAGDYNAARGSFEEALRYNDKDGAVLLGLGMTYFKLGDDRSAERELSRAAAISPKESGPYQLLGEIYYRRDDLSAAASYWEKAVELDPSSSELRNRLERIRKEHRTEKDFNRDMTSHFQVKYEGREKIEAGRIILRILEDAYGEIGRALSYYPDREIQVILYSSGQFSEVTDAPGWSGGIYDGKIRLPIGGIEKETPGLRRLLFHEYTHAAVRAITARCPAWLNEGLAQYFEGLQVETRHQDNIRKTAQTGKIPPLSSLEGSFTGLNADQARLAYLFSLSSVRYLIDNFGMYRAKAVLDELSAGADIRKAVGSGVTLSYEEFERGWKASLE